MGFRYDTRHLSLQQRAIINQRDQEDKLSQEEARKKKDAEIKESIDGKCPTCGSTDVESTGNSHGAGVVLPGEMHKTYHCKQCDEIFD